MAKTHKKISFSHWALVLAFLAGSSFLVKNNASDFLASVIPTKQAPAYNGLALPVQKAPAWADLTTAQYKMSYDQIPADKLVPLPVYDANVLKTPTSQLKWTAADKAIRNAKITYSTPYMGDYKLDGLENAGSHLAIDIKIPDLTPIYAIGNGIVVKVSKQSGGFGNHIVVEHDNFPSFSNPNVKTTYFSTYNHLTSIAVSEGDIVTKGQQIALSGHSGDSTTPHLHFQIDNNQAPWHPYWPFTYSEAADAGLDFTGAVNAGLGKDKALATTINPMMYVQKYLNGSAAASDPAPTPTPTTPPVSTPPPANNAGSDSSSGAPSTGATDSNAANGNSSANSGSSTNVENPGTQVYWTPGSATPPATPPPASGSNNPPATPPQSQAADSTVVSTSNISQNIQSPAVGFKFLGNESFVVGASEKIMIQAVDAKGNVTKDYKPKDGVSLSVENGSAQVLTTYLTANDFSDGKALFSVIPTGKQGLRLKANDGSIVSLSDVMQTSDTFTDISANSDIYTAVDFLKTNNVINGYPDGSFKPTKVVSRVEALKFIVQGNPKLAAANSFAKAVKLPFKDVNLKEWYAPYVATAYSKRIVKGYGDSTFKPAQIVTKAEFLKMLLLAMGITPNPVNKNVFTDVNKDMWYAPYVAYAKEKNLIDTSSNLFRPTDGITRAEVGQLIYKIIVMQMSGESSFKAGLVVSDTKAKQYFARRG